MRNGAKLMREKIEAGGFLKGFAATLCDPAVSEMAGCAGYDFVFIDAEHSPLGRQDIFRHIMASQGAGACAMVRVRSEEPPMLKAILDMGPDGVIFPFVHDAATARRAVSACAYPDSPYRGVRGQGPMRAVRYGFGDEEEYLNDACGYCLRFMQIESFEGYRNLDEILAVPGVDGVYLGPADLLRSLRAHAEEHPPSLESICDDVYRRVRAAGKLMGVPLGLSKDAVQSAIGKGAQWGVCGIDAVLLSSGMRACLTYFETEPEG